MSQCTDARLHMRAMPVFWSGRNLNGPGYESVQLEDLVDGDPTAYTDENDDE